MIMNHFGLAVIAAMAIILVIVAETIAVKTVDHTPAPAAPAKRVDRLEPAPIEPKTEDRLLGDRLTDYRLRLQMYGGKTFLQAEACTHDGLVEALRLAKAEAANQKSGAQVVSWDAHLGPAMVKYCDLVW
jgi:hypothetical protein